MRKLCGGLCQLTLDTIPLRSAHGTTCSRHSAGSKISSVDKTGMSLARPHSHALRPVARRTTLSQLWLRLVSLTSLEFHKWLRLVSLISPEFENFSRHFETPWRPLHKSIGQPWKLLTP
jgi:hypothetical protein